MEPEMKTIIDNSSNDLAKITNILNKSQKRNVHCVKSN